MVRVVRPNDWEPASDAMRLQREMNRLERRARRSDRAPGSRVFPAIVISATDEKLVIRTEIPGMVLDDFDISVSGDTLTIMGTRATGQDLEEGWYHRRERASGGFSRAVRLPAEVDGDRAEATYLAGVLSISLPLKEAAKPKHIPVQVVEA
ncbi:MAG: Hsp20/alpha crystallin family protein [Anaerolineae bacterium]